MKKTLFLICLLAGINSFTQSLVPGFPQNNKQGVRFNPGTLPEFKGGDTALQKYVREHLIMDKKQAKITNGTSVDITFTIDSTGIFCNVVKPITHPSQAEPEVSQVALDMLKGMPQWIPGRSIYNGEDYAVNVTMTMTLYYPVKTDTTDIPARVQLKRMYHSHLGTREQEAQPVFMYAQTMPTAPYDFNQYLVKHIHYPAMEKETNIQGSVYLAFVVETDGTITNVNVVKGVNGGSGLEYEAGRVIAEMPKWNPGTMNGNPVRIQITQPVRFTLQ